MTFWKIVSVIAVLTALASESFAQLRGSSFGGSSRRGGVSLSGEHSIGFGLALITSDQDDMNNVIDDANEASPTGNAKNIGSGYEFFAQYAVRFDRSWWGFVFRPSIMSQSAKGTCLGGSCKYSVDGVAFFPMIRMVPLESDIIKFFFQVGLGYGQMNGKMTQPGGTVKFKGSAFGALGGLGVDFCLTESSCITVEGNLRYLPIERNLVTSGSTTGMTGIDTGADSGDEIEKDGKDLATTMSGLQGLISYTMYF